MSKKYSNYLKKNNYTTNSFLFCYPFALPSPFILQFFAFNDEEIKD